MGARTLNAWLGLWLFLSGFLWTQTPFQRWNAWVVGALAVMIALAGLSGAVRARYMNVALGGWLILSALLPPRPRLAVFWNELLVGFALALLAMVASGRDLRGRRTANV